MDKRTAPVPMEQLQEVPQGQRAREREREREFWYAREGTARQGKDKEGKAR